MWLRVESQIERGSPIQNRRLNGFARVGDDTRSRSTVDSFFIDAAEREER
jgi:hypothetical protein